MRPLASKLSGQPIPQLPPEPSPPAPLPAAAPPLAAAEFDPATGGYIGPDGRHYTQSDLAQGAPEKTWQMMLVPPSGN